jgi:hypothetical protein
MTVRPLNSVYTPTVTSYGPGSETDTDVQGNKTCDVDKCGSVEGRYLLAWCEVAGLVASVLSHTLWLIVSYKKPSWYGWTARLALISAVRLSYPIVKLATLVTAESLGTHAMTCLGTHGMTCLDTHEMTCPCEAVGMLLWVPIHLNGHVFAAVDSLAVSLFMLTWWCIGYQVRQQSNAMRLRD